MTEPTTTEAPTTNNAPAVASEPATTNAAGSVNAEASQTNQPVADSGKTDAVKADAPKGAPEKYDLKAPSERQFDNEVMSSFSEIAKELNLTNESAQKILDKVGSKMLERHEAGLSALSQEWSKASTADKEFGGDSLQQNLAIAKKALDTFGSPELRSLLNQSPLGNHPELIRFFYRAGKAISEDQYVVTNGNSGSNKSAARDFASAAAALYSTNQVT